MPTSSNRNRVCHRLLKYLTVPVLWRLIWFCRFPVCFALFLATFAPISVFFSPTLLANGFLLSGSLQMATLTAMTLVCATLLFIQIDIIRTWGAWRFADLADLRRLNLYYHRLQIRARSGKRRFWNWPILRTILWAICGLSLPLTCWAHSVSERISNPYTDDPGLSGVMGLVGIAIGALIYLLAIQLVVAVELLLKSSDRVSTSFLPMNCLIGSGWSRKSVATNWMQRYLGWLVDSVYTKSTKQLPLEVTEQRDSALAVSFILLCVLHVCMYLASCNSEIPNDGWFSTPFLMVFSLTQWSLVISAVAYFLDYYRTPVLVVLGVAWFAWYRLADIDYRFQVIRLPEVVDADERIGKLRPVVDGEYDETDKFLFKPTTQDSKGKTDVDKGAPTSGRSGRTVLVVVAPGGGIHASAWTGRVLSGLHARYRHDFQRSLALISAVSGGSVGAMFYLNDFDELQTTLHRKRACDDLTDVEKDKVDETVRRIFRRSSTSSLESLAWGAAFPDTMRLFGGKFVQDDRGAAQERRWLGRLDSTGAAWGPTLKQWKRRAVESLKYSDETHERFPFVVFNATEAETGRRILFSTVELPADHNLPPETRPIDFLSKARDQFDLPVVTAVRLSATFPYFAPASMPANDTLSFGHVVDGGYADNDGVLTAIEIIRRWICDPAVVHSEDQIKRIVMIRICHVPANEPKLVRSTDPGLNGAGWQYAAVGPLVAMGNVRSTSQRERGSLELQILRRGIGALVPTEKREFINKELELVDVTITFRKIHGYSTPPLNWKLSPKQRDAYESAWQQIVDSADKSLSRPGKETPNSRTTSFEGLEQLDYIFGLTENSSTPSNSNEYRSAGK